MRNNRFSPVAYRFYQLVDELLHFLGIGYGTTWGRQFCLWANRETKKGVAVMDELLEYGIVWNDDVKLGFFVKGHVDKDLFSKTIESQENRVILSTEEIMYGYMLYVPAEEDCFLVVDWVEFSLSQHEGWEEVTGWGNIWA